MSMNVITALVYLLVQLGPVFCVGSSWPSVAKSLFVHVLPEKRLDSPS